jgi:hypothetical protein
MLPRNIRIAKEQGERMMRLAAEVAEQVNATQENLCRSRDLLNSFGKGYARASDEKSDPMSSAPQQSWGYLNAASGAST